MNGLTKLITLIFLLNSCGSKSDSNGAESIAQVEATEITPPSSSPEHFTYSMMIDSEADLPSCDDSRKRQLVYIKETSQFKACSNSKWEVVSIKGEKGDKGDTGVAGPQGSTGAQGVAGTNGTNGTNGTVVNSNMWYDTIDKKYWLIPSVEKTATIANATASCGTSDYRLPTYSELLNAVGRGLRTAADAISAPKEGFIEKNGSEGVLITWVDVGSGRNFSEQYVRTGNVMDGSAGFYCIQK
jgi:hypothetical protein